MTGVSWFGVLVIESLPPSTTTQAQPEPNRVAAALPNSSLNFAKLPKEADVPEGPLELSPDLVVEVRSPSNSSREMRDKAKEYLDSGVKVVVVIEPQTESVWVDRGVDWPQGYHNGDVLTLPDVLPGFSVPVKQQDKTLSFDLPDGKGTFRGMRVGNEIDGQWIQPVTVEGGARYATPLVLRSDGVGRWTGSVAPREDHMTYYLPVTRGAGGAHSAYLRNPERNQGVFLGVSRIEQDGDVVRLVGARGQDQENVIASGRRDPESGTFSLPLPWGTFDFARETDASSPFYARGNPPQRYRYAPPLQFDDGWPVSTLEKEGIDQGAIEKFVQKLIDMPQEDVSTSQIHMWSVSLASIASVTRKVNCSFCSS